MREHFTTHKEECDRIQKWMNTQLKHPLIDAVIVMMFMEIGHSRGGTCTYMVVGEECTHQIENISSTSAIGDMPSSTYYAQYFCATPAYIERRLRCVAEFRYGPFMIKRHSTGVVSYDATSVPNAELADEQGYATATYIHPTSNLLELLGVIDKYRCSKMPFEDLPTIKE